MSQEPSTKHYREEVTAGELQAAGHLLATSVLLLASISLLREPRIPSTARQSTQPPGTPEIADSTMALQLPARLTNFTSCTTTDGEMSSISRCALLTVPGVTRTKSQANRTLQQERH